MSETIPHASSTFISGVSILPVELTEADKQIQDDALEFALSHKKDIIDSHIPEQLTRDNLEKCLGSG